MFVFMVTGGWFPLTSELPQRKKNPLTWANPSAGIKPLRGIQIAMSIALSLSWPKRRKNLADGVAHTYIAYSL